MMKGRALDIDGNPIGFHLTVRGNLVVENTLENSIHEGRRFYLRNYQNIANEDVVNFLVVPSEGYDLHVDLGLKSDVLCDVKIYINPTVTNYGDEQTLRNHNQNYIASTFYSNVYKDITVSANGTLALADKVESGKHVAATRYSTGEFVLVYPYSAFMIITAEEGPGYLTWDFGATQTIARSY